MEFKDSTLLRDINIDIIKRPFNLCDKKMPIPSFPRRQESTKNNGHYMVKKNISVTRNTLSRDVFFIIATCFFLLIECSNPSDKNTKKKLPEESKKYSQSVIGDVDPLAQAEATPGGELTTWGGSFPKSLNKWRSYTSFSDNIMNLMFEPLITIHSTENRPIGILAKSWDFSKDKKTYRITLRKEARWSDGMPITAYDIQFYYDVIMDPKNLTPIFKIGLKRFDRPKVIDEHTFEITANTSHWKNFWEVGGITPFPKHVWKKVDFNQQNFEFPVVSGPYALNSVKKNRSMSLIRRADWWGRILAYNQYKYNFNFIKYRFMEDRVKSLEAFKKGDFDVYAIYTSKIWIKQTHFEAVEKGWVNREKIYNQKPLSFQGLAINLRRPKFQDVRVRRALAHLLNRDKINEKLMYGQYFIQNNYYPDLYPDKINPKAETIKYDPNKARSLLKEAGWEVNAKGQLEKNNDVFKITFLIFSPGTLPHLTIYIEDLKDVGIDASIEQLSYPTIKKRLDKREFDMHWMNWGASRLRDPEALWYSDGAYQEASNNIPGLVNKIIDKLIEKQRNIFDIDQRNAIIREIDAVLVKEIPYILLWQSDHHRLLSWNKFGRPPSVLDKYNSEESLIAYWWYDQAKADKLAEARERNQALIKNDRTVYYQEK